MTPCLCGLPHDRVDWTSLPGRSLVRGAAAAAILAARGLLPPGPRSLIPEAPRPAQGRSDAPWDPTVRLVNSDYVVPEDPPAPRLAAPRIRKGERMA
jgi:hypothetical protein